jgi:hypothetical protein
MLVLCAVLTGLLVAAAVATLGGRFGTMLGSGAAAAGLFAISIGTLEGRRVARKQRRWVPRRQTPTTETRST